MAIFEVQSQEPGLDLLAVQETSDVSWWKSLVANLRDLLSPAKLPPLDLTSRPLTPQEMAARVGCVDLMGMQLDNDRGLWKRLRAEIHDFLFPSKLPPLQLTSQPVQLREVWGAYNYKKDGAAASIVIHLLMVGAIVTFSTFSLSKPKRVEVKPPLQQTELVLPPDIALPMSPKKDATLSGGGGGGDRDKLQAPKGKLPRFAMEQLTPPAVVIRNDHPKLTAEPTVIMPPQVKLPLAANMPNFGDPLSKLPSGPPSNGTGSGGGIGSGHGGGVGSGEGGGVGPGRGGGFGGGVFRPGIGGVSAPKVLFAPDPDYSEEARKAKYQGTVILWLIVGPDGRPRDIRVARTLGMGLDQKAVEAVRNWKFDPARKDGQPVSVQINVEVNFRLY